MDRISICEEFNEYFKIILALTPKQQDESFRIRYEVFAKEFGWEPKNKEEMEKDEFDSYSLHCLIYHKRTNSPAGSLRLVMPDQGVINQNAPFQKHCQDNISADRFNFSILNSASYGEASRLAVLSSFRRRKDEDKNAIPILDQPKIPNSGRRHFPHIAMGLYLTGVSIVDLASIDYVFAMMEPRLARHLKRFGVMFNQGSEIMDYHGKRALYYIPREDFTRHLPPDVKELYLSIRDSIYNQLAKNPNQMESQKLSNIS